MIWGPKVYTESLLKGEMKQQQAALSLIVKYFASVSPRLYKRS